MHAHARKSTGTRAYTCTRARARAHARTHHTRTHARARTHTHAHTHTALQAAAWIDNNHANVVAVPGPHDCVIEWTFLYLHPFMHTFIHLYTHMRIPFHASFLEYVHIICIIVHDFTEGHEKPSHMLRATALTTARRCTARAARAGRASSAPPSCSGPGARAARLSLRPPTPVSPSLLPPPPPPHPPGSLFERFRGFSKQAQEARESVCVCVCWGMER